jgi:hypothetical protein
MGTLTYSVQGVTVNKLIEKQVFSLPVPTCIAGTGSREGETNYQDLWWNSAESGWGINLTHQGNIIFATLFTYDNAGVGMWLVASALVLQSDGSFAGALYLTEGPPFNSVPWTAIAPTQVGDMRLRFTSGERGQLTYSAFGTNVAKNVERQVFAAGFPVCR